VLDAEIGRILALGVTFAGGADLGALEAGAARVVKTKVYETGTPVATGAIAAAVHFGRHAAGLLVAELNGVSPVVPRRLPGVDKARVQADYHPHLSRGAATGDTWTPAGAIAEARRCLSCGACFECDSCYKYCPDQAVLKPLGPGEPYRFKLEFCQGCNKCAEQCPSNYIEMR
jgi:Pyruvate/2-oxoacid:ferredoxin oxidoreductase delta subunit